MNQILSVDNNGKEKRKKSKVKTNGSGPVEINKIVKFFSIAILVFGIFLIGSGSYSMYIDSKTKNSNLQPSIYIEKLSQKELMLRIDHNKALSKVSYRWNDEQETQVQTNGKSQVETKIEIPTGTNVLNISAVDINGVESTHPQTFTVEGDIKINIEPEGTKLKVTAEGKNNLKYLTYRWDEEDETKVDINDIKIDQTIDIPKGEHNLTVIVVDEKNTTEKKEQKVKGITKPKLDITTDGSSNFIINAEDDQGIKKVEFKLNNKKFVLKLDEVYPLEERKKFEYSYPFIEGKNVLTVTIYNENDVTETKKVKVTI